MKVLTTPMLIVSSANTAIDLMDKRSTIYSDKPAMVMDDLCVHFQGLHSRAYTDLMGILTGQGGSSTSD
jgi:hypothetical protein